MELSLQAKNGNGVIGNTLTIATDSTDVDINKTIDGDAGKVIDPTATPVISNLTLSGSLAIGSQLSAGYIFDANSGWSIDKSTYAWGHKGNTAGNVSRGRTITTSGTVPGYTLQLADAGQVMEVSVQARSQPRLTGNILTLTSDSTDANNNTTGGGPSGIVIDPAAAPEISNLTLSGDLASGNTLTAHYTFDARGGDTTDHTQYRWNSTDLHGVGPTYSGRVDPLAGQTLSHTLTDIDVGNIITIQLHAENGLNIQGNMLTVASNSAAPENETTGGDGTGHVIIPVYPPEISRLFIRGTLNVGQTLVGRWDYNSGIRGDTSDFSIYKWGYKGTTVANISTGSAVDPGNRQVSYTLRTADAGQVIELSIQAKNRNNVTGNIATATTETGGGLYGGDGTGRVIDPSAQPGVANISLRGSLYVGNDVHGNYTFLANKGDITDQSIVEWGYKGQAGSLQSSRIINSGQLRSYVLKPADAGKIMEVRVTPQNSLGVTGNVVTLATDSSTNNTTTGGSGGGVVGNPP